MSSFKYKINWVNAFPLLEITNRYLPMQIVKLYSNVSRPFSADTPCVIITPVCFLCLNQDTVIIDPVKSYLLDLK